jgi:hypothetical protein
VKTTLMVHKLPSPKQKRLGRRLNDRQQAALVTGRVNDKKGSPVPKGSIVVWKDGRGTPSPFSDGRFAVAMPQSGAYRIELRGPGFRKSSQELRVEQGEVYKIDVILQPGGTIKGRVIDMTGRPVSDGDVFYRDGNTSFGVPLENDGTYRIDGLAPGPYKVSVIQGDKEVSRQSEVAAGAETVLDFIWK